MIQSETARQYALSLATCFDIIIRLTYENIKLLLSINKNALCRCNGNEMSLSDSIVHNVNVIFVKRYNCCCPYEVTQRFIFKPSKNLSCC